MLCYLVRVRAAVALSLSMVLSAIFEMGNFIAICMDNKLDCTDVSLANTSSHLKDRIGRLPMITKHIFLLQDI